MKRAEKEQIFCDMQELGLAALSHVNRMDDTDKWDELYLWHMQLKFYSRLK